MTKIAIAICVYDAKQNQCLEERVSLPDTCPDLLGTAVKATVEAEGYDPVRMTVYHAYRVTQSKMRAP